MRSRLTELAGVLVLVTLVISVEGEETGRADRSDNGAPAMRESSARRARVAALAAAWPATPSVAPLYDALDPTTAPASGVERSTFDPDDPYWGLPRTQGYLLVAGYCGYCHSLRIVMQQHTTRARWSELLDWMVTQQGMPALAPEDRRVLLAYLSRHFGTEAQIDPAPPAAEKSSSP